ncbi:HAD-IA family hydrolase [bacterium]|jgi:HAD superfamily hydrolase (TIGR01509 family)|nr:HAD-IA family hydrolase [bacterium]MBT4121463.1 HAD-IA family hydrolase [bacterium]MBT4335604.1 HAD-IA family hydrolase [bacterium]MBT4495462.1 HAD-IA family hydrolase [bacterium]MBT4764260.1 HAD-IA family hydrolase [bacterium]
MKTILVDAINTFVIKEVGIFNEMHQMLEEYPNKKIILTSANDEQVKMFKLDNMPYEIFTLKHEPEKTDPNYYKTMLSNFNLNAQDVIYFEHNKEAVESAKSVGIKTFHYNKDTKDLTTLKKFIDKEL